MAIKAAKNMIQILWINMSHRSFSVIIRTVDCCYICSILTLSAYISAQYVFSIFQTDSLCIIFPLPFSDISIAFHHVRRSCTQIMRALGDDIHKRFFQQLPAAVLRTQAEAPRYRLSIDLQDHTVGPEIVQCAKIAPKITVTLNMGQYGSVSCIQKIFKPPDNIPFFFPFREINQDKTCAVYRAAGTLLQPGDTVLTVTKLISQMQLHLGIFFAHIGRQPGKGFFRSFDIVSEIAG